MTRHFDPVTLRLFVAACEERSLARAAEREALVASALSKRIAALERSVGAPLLVRRRRGIEPTAAGQSLLRQARELLAAMERMHAELSEFTTGVQGSVRVMASVSALAERLPDDIAAFLARHRSVRVSLDEGLSRDIVRAVREGHADLAVLWSASEMAGLRTQPYRSDHLCAVMPSSHALARRKRLSFADTLAHPAIGVAAGGTMETLLRREATRAGHTLVRRVQVASLDAACRIVAAGLGLAILPREAVAPLARDAALVMVPLSDAWAERRFVVCSRDDAMQSATVRLLLEHLRREADAV